MTTNQIKTGGLLFYTSGLLYVGASVFLGQRVLYSFLGLGATLLLALSIRTVGAYMEADANQKALKYGVLTMLIGVPFLIGIYGTAYAEAVTNITQRTADILNTITILIGSTLTYGVSPALIAYSGLKGSLVPKWLSWVGMIGGLFGLMWAGWVWAIPPDNILILLPSVLLTYIWQLGLGVVLMRHKESKDVLIQGAGS